MKKNGSVQNWFRRVRARVFRPSLGLFDAAAISLGAIIGGGIFVVTGIAAGYAGSAVVISMLIAGIISMLTALSFIELTAWLPKEGGAYEYAYRMISPFGGFLSGWMWMLSTTFAGAAVSLSFAYYFTAIFPVMPPTFIAAVLCIGFTILNYYGIKESALVNNLLLVLELLILAFFCVFGAFFIKSANFGTFVPLQTGVLFGAFYIFFAFGKFARVSVVAEEVKDAKRNVPKALLLSIALSVIFYNVVSLVAVGLVGASRLAGSNSPLKLAIAATGSSGAVYLVSVAGLLATASVLLTSILGVSRMAYAMAKRDALPQSLGQLHAEHNTPYLSVLVSGGIMTLFALTIGLSSVIAISTFSMLIYYAAANISAMRLKAENRNYPRIIPFLGTASCLGLLAFVLFISTRAWIAGALGLLVGAIYYAANRRA